MPFQTGTNRRTTILNEADEILREKRREDAKREADELMKAMAPPAVPDKPSPAQSRPPMSTGGMVDVLPSKKPIRPNPLNPNPEEWNRFSNAHFDEDINLPLSASTAGKPIPRPTSSMFGAEGGPVSVPGMAMNPSWNAPQPTPIPRPAAIPMDKPAPKLTYPSASATPGNLSKQFGVFYSDPAYVPASQKEKDDFRKRVLALSGELKARGIEHKLMDFGSRSQGAQDAAKDSGHSQLGGTNTDTPSTHPLGVGVDIWLYRNGKAVGGDDPLYKQYGELAEKHGFTWGGRWKDPYDPRHIQLRPISKNRKPDNIAELSKKKSGK